MRGSIPKNLARPGAQTEDFPLLNVIVLGRTRISIKAHLKWRGLALVDRSRDKQSVSPNNRAGVAQAGNRPFPQNIFRLFRVPNRSGYRPLCNPVGIRSAKP